jgi:hypothetical protein
MWWGRQGHVKVLALLAGPSDFLALDGFLESCRGATHFAIYNVILESLTACNCPVDKMFAQVVHNARDFANLLEGQYCMIFEQKSVLFCTSGIADVATSIPPP